MEINIKWNICRVCLVEDEKEPQMSGTVEPMRHIFNEDEMLPKQIYECSGITMKPNDNLPQKICKKCLTMIKYAVNFRKTCRASDTYLQSILQRTKSASELFKPQQRLLENTSEEIISKESMSNNKNESEIGESDASNAVKQSNTFKRKGTHLDNTTTSWMKSDSAGINSNSDDLIELEVEDNISENSLNIVEEAGLLNYSEPSGNQMLVTTKEDNTLDEALNIDDEGNEESQIDANSMETSHANELIYEGDDFEVNEETAPNDLKDKNNEKENIMHVKSNEQKLVNEDPIKIDEPEDDNSELIKLEEESQKEILEQLETDMEENQAQVSSTVSTKEFDFIEMQEEDSSLSTETNVMKTEYIIDEYVIYGNSSDVPLQNSSVLVFNSKHRSQAELDNKKTPGGSKSSLKISSERQVWICDLCGNHFNNRQVLNVHMKIHRQEKKHECEICFKRFITACNLKAHMRIHTGEKPFECQYCFRRFSDRSSNLRHERIHTNAKPFQCKECGKAFSLATTLKKHLTIHSGVRSYRCDICAKSFKLPHQLKAHKNSSAHKAVAAGWL